MENVPLAAHLLADQKQSQIIMEQIKAFKTSDGTLFDSKDKAERHEEFLKHSDVIEAFLSSDMNPYIAGPQRVIARNTILNWQIWNTKNVE